MRIILIGAMVITLVACQTIQTRPAALTSAQVAKVKAGVLASLKDSDSARFGRIAAGVTDKGLIKVCGVVSAKNSFGGYAENAFEGWLLPTGEYRHVDIATETGGANMAVAILSNCKADGIEI